MSPLKYDLPRRDKRFGKRQYPGGIDGFPSQLRDRKPEINPCQVMLRVQLLVQLDRSVWPAKRDYGFFDPRDELFTPTVAMDIFGLGSTMYTTIPPMNNCTFSTFKRHASTYWQGPLQGTPANKTHRIF